MNQLKMRPAEREDIESIVRLLADDAIGATRENVENLDPYFRAFEEVSKDANQLLVVAELEGEVVGTMHMTMIPGLSHHGSTRGLVESVRIDSSRRGGGLGRELMRWAIAEFQRRGCKVIQLTSMLPRTDAHRFYLSLGFEQTHLGFSMKL